MINGFYWATGKLNGGSAALGGSSPERQSARLSKITNDGLRRSGTGCFYSCTHLATVGVRGI